MLILMDSRARKHTGKRIGYPYSATSRGMRSAWSRVLHEEVPLEEEHYLSCLQGDVREDIGYFNDLWAMYGWHLEDYEVCAVTSPADDVTIVWPGSKTDLIRE